MPDRAPRRSVLVRIVHGIEPVAAVLAIGAASLWAQRAPAPGASNAYERSLALVRQALESRPDDPGLLGVLGDVHFRRGRFREAALVYEHLVRRHPRAGDALVSLGSARMQLEEDAAALAAYRSALALDDPSLRRRARRGIADAHAVSGDIEKAVAELRSLVASGAAGVDDEYELGRCLADLARMPVASASGAARGPATALEAEAVATLVRVLARDPSHYEAHYVLSGLYRKQGKKDLASRELEEFRRLKPTSKPLDAAELAAAEAVFEARSAVQAARAIFAAGDAVSALALVDAALRVQPRFHEALSFKGWILLGGGRKSEAAALYEAALREEPDSADALWNLGKLRLDAGDARGGAPLLARSADLRRVFPEAWEILFRLTQENGLLVERAEEFARNALRDRPSPANYATLAFFLYERGEAGEALRILDEGLRRHPRSEDLIRGRAALASSGVGK